MAGTNLFDMLTSSAGQGAVQKIGQQFGMDEAQTQQALKALLPAISGGLKRNATQTGGLESLMNALQNGQHDAYLDDPDGLGQPETVADGNAILGHLLGSKEVSREVASKASARTGIPDTLLKQLLPVVATMAMGALSKQSKNPSIQQAIMGAIAGQVMGGAAKGGALGGLLGGLLGGKKREQAAAQAAHSAQGGDQGMLGMLGGLLDADGDGNPMDDILEMVMKRR